MTLSDFLLARIAEDEAKVRAAIEDAVGDVSIKDDTDTTVMGVDLREMLADLEAKRRIVEVCDDYEEPAPTVLRALALPFASHPDYDESWKP